MIARLIAAALVLTGPAALGDWTRDAPGVTRRITVKDLPAPGASGSGFAPPEAIKRPAGARLSVPAGFTVTEFARLQTPRQLRTAPNGDVFAAETGTGQIAVLRAPDGASKAAVVQTFATGLDRPFGLAFFPPGPDPQWLYVANANAVVRFPYRNGDLKPRGHAEVIVPRLAASTRGHSTRDVAFSPNGRWMYVSVGSGSNDAEGMPRKSPAQAEAFDAVHGLGAAWGEETDRADVLIMDPRGRGRRVLAAGLRNCVTMAVQPSGTVWCAVNERDGMGDNLPPDYVTRVRDHAFYGWPWFYIGDHPDPRHRGERADLAGKVTVPDVLIQAHSAPLGMTFYTARGGAAAFPAAYQGDAFVALHGSWNRSRRTGYKVVLVMLSNGAPTGSYQDFLTGFAGAQGVWGRPVGVAVAHDGALLVSDDGGGIVWRVARAPGDK